MQTKGLARIAAAILLALACGLLQAQTTAGRFSGTITDPRGAGVPGSNVTALDSETGQKISAATNGEGQFVLYPLPPGTYSITARKEGFSWFAISALWTFPNRSRATSHCK